MHDDMLRILSTSGIVLGAIRLRDDEDPHKRALSYPGLDYMWKGKVYHASTKEIND